MNDYCVSCHKHTEHTNEITVLRKRSVSVMQHLMGKRAKKGKTIENMGSGLCDECAGRIKQYILAMIDKSYPGGVQ